MALTEAEIAYVETHATVFDFRFYDDEGHP